MSVETVELTTAFGATSGAIRLLRYGNLRILSFDSAVTPEIGYFTYQGFPIEDRPSRVIPHGTLTRTDNNTIYGMWIRYDGTIGQSNYSSGISIRGTITWLVN